MASDLKSVLKPILVPIHKEGWPFMMVFAIITILLGLLWKPLFFIGLVLTAWCAYFFRDPVRITPTRPGLVISPADGVVQSIEKATPPEELQMGPDQLVRVAVFMNVFDVHINRAPVSATVGLRHYTPGKFLNASLDKASVDNERISWRFDLDDGRKLAAIQIAGLVARRILPFAEKDERLRVGERFGMIRFGSRVDIYLPQGVNPLVAVGQRAIAGETVLADLDPPAGQQEAARQAIAQ